MSRRKQSKPRQIKRSLGDLDGGEENTPDNLSLSGEDGGASDQDDSAEGDGCSPRSFTPLHNEEPRTHDSGGGGGGGGGGGPDGEDGEGEELAQTHSGNEEDEEQQQQQEDDDGDEDEEASSWRGPDDLRLNEDGVVAAADLRPDTTWGPYTGIVQSEGSTRDQEAEMTNR